MAWFIFILFFLAIFHFIVESILLPTERLKIRYKLFTLRDRLRKLKCDNENSISDEEYNYVQHSINCAINLIPHVNLFLIHDVVRTIDSNTYLQKQVLKRIETLKNSDFPELINISRKANNYVFNAMLLNLSGWSIYLIPVLVVLIPVLIVVGVIKKFKKKLFEVIVAPEHQISKLIPSHDLVGFANDHYYSDPRIDSDRLGIIESKTRNAATLKHIEDEIDHSSYITKLEPGWNGENALIISKEVYQSSIDFLREYSSYLLIVLGIQVEAPEINPCPDGSIDLSWRTQKARMLINIKQKDKEVFAFYYGDYGQKRKPIKGNIPVKEFEEALAVWMKNLV